MRRHPPHLIRLAEKHRNQLQRLVRDGRTEQRTARRARVLLAMENEQTIVEDLAAKVEMSPRGIWSLCRRYEERGAQAVFDTPRSGHPRKISPLVRVQIEQLACCEPIGVGPWMTH